MPDITAKVQTSVQENKNFHLAMMETLMLTDKEAAADSMAENYGDLILSWWSSIPTEDKRGVLVYNLEGSKKVSAVEAWAEAQSIQPKDTEGKDPAELEKTREARQRHAREKQIIIDVLYHLNFLYKKIEDSWDDGEDDTPWAEGKA